MICPGNRGNDAQKKKGADQEEINRGDAKTLIETPRISSRDEWAHPDVSDEFRHIDNYEPIERVEKQLAFGG